MPSPGSRLQPHLPSQSPSSLTTILPKPAATSTRPFIISYPGVYPPDSLQYSLRLLHPLFFLPHSLPQGKRSGEKRCKLSKNSQPIRRPTGAVKEKKTQKLKILGCYIAVHVARAQKLISLTPFILIGYRVMVVIHVLAQLVRYNTSPQPRFMHHACRLDGCLGCAPAAPDFSSKHRN